MRSILSVYACPVAVVCALGIAQPGIARPVKLSSLNRQVSAEVTTDAEGHVALSVTRGGVPVLLESPIGIVVDGVDLGADATVNRFSNAMVHQRFDWNGLKSKVNYNANEETLRIETEAGEWKLQVQASDSGVAYRCIVPGAGAQHVDGESTVLAISGNADLWVMTDTGNYEGTFQKTWADSVPTERKDNNGNAHPVTLGMPLTFRLGDGTYGAITEAGVLGYTGATLQSLGDSRFGIVYEDDAGGLDIDGEIVTPWRVIMTGPTLNDLVNSDMVAALAPAPDPALFPKGAKTDWIEPGRCGWQWWAFGSDGTNWDRQKHLVDGFAALGLEYYLVDDGWEQPHRGWFDDSGSPWPRMKELVDYAAERGVKILVWRAWREYKDWHHPGLETHEKREAFFAKCAEVGVAGAKIDFMDAESHDILDFYEDCLRVAAKHKVLVNFHGAYKPTGEARTWPNEISREGIRGLEQKNLSPDHYATLPFTRYLAGAGDFTPVTMQTRFLHGTTFAMQLASAVVFNSPMLCYADDPYEYLNSKVSDWLREIPATWDETRVLEPSAIGELAVFAKRKGKTWWVGVLNGGDAKRVEIDFSFLKGRSGYTIETVSDVMGLKPTLQIGAAAKLDTSKPYAIKLEAGGGFVGRIEAGE